MNNREWPEFWADTEAEDEDDDEYNDIGSDVDANNDETFDNAAEWNEDEHEEFSVRDVLERQLLKTKATPPNHVVNNLSDPPKRSGWSPFGGKDLFTTPDSPNQNQAGRGQNFLGHSTTPQSMSAELQEQLLSQYRQQQQRNQQNQQHYPHLQRQQQLLQQQHLLQQQQQQQLKQMALLRQQQIQQEQRLMSQNPQCFFVEELERQMLQERSKDPENSASEIREQPNQPMQEVSTKPRRNEKQQDSRNSAWQDNGNRLDRPVRHEGDIKDGREYRDQRLINADQRDLRDRRDHRDQRDYREREHRDNRDHRDHRENRDHRNNRESKRRYIIVPPQVQLSVIDTVKRHTKLEDKSDEFLQDKMTSLKDGLLFKRHSAVRKEKIMHDGVLTEKERSWLTRIQEKIQADYDDNLDQDYYYLLYFNRSSMTDEAANKPCGPGVLDRRFIPRERLLYNSST